MEVKSIADINHYMGSSVNPLNTPDTMYELYSVPSFDSQYPEIIKGADIGSTKLTVEEGDVLICKINPRINRVWVVKHHTEYPLLASSEWIVVRNSEIDSNYLKWYFSSPTFRKLLVSQVAGIGGSLTRAQPKQVAKYPVPIPVYSTQQEISSILGRLDFLVSLRKQQLVKLEELVKARFVEMFGDESNPYNWPYCAVRDVADVCVGVVIKPTQYYTNNGIPAFRSLNIGEMSVKNFDWVYFTQEGHQKNQKSIVRENDVLVVRSGAPGTACVAAKEYAGHNAVDIIIAHPDSSKVNSYFLAMFTNMPHGMIQIRGKIGGAAQQHFNVSGYKSMKLFLPSLCSQNEFALFIEQVDEFRLTIQKSLDKMEVLKKALMKEYFGG